MNGRAAESECEMAEPDDGSAEPAKRRGSKPSRHSSGHLPFHEPDTGAGRQWPVVIAHRGSSATRPENTIPAFRAAWSAGVGATSRVFLQSFEIPVLARLRALQPDRPVGLLAETIDDDPIAQCQRWGATAYNPNYAELLRRPELVAELHSAGIAIAPWTVDDVADGESLSSLGVDGIITNRPAAMLARRESTAQARDR